MIDKLRSIDEALGAVKSGQTVMVGGFGGPGTPFVLLDRLVEQGVDGLTLVKNDANEPGTGVSRLIEAGRAHTLIASHIGLNPLAVERMNRREIEVLLYPQGILAEKIRAGGAGLIGILTDIGLDTVLRESRQVMHVDGQEAIYEPALRGDVALIHAAKADRAGNLLFARSGRNFCPLMAMAADTVIAEVEEVVETGELDPDAVHLPCAFVDHLVLLEELTPDYGVLPHHVL
ncbi:CoA transferase subunit A [Desulfuromonas sp. TF]|uniref:CoA transferase subunit A n=1 Tax=Desulfuromonas sp. TF TaxID=1232410 RepID=UPI0004286E2B|nr:3-oxoacid CoA-transferase subunit A [Desulfuromonas sp. TF]